MKKTVLNKIKKQLEAEKERLEKELEKIANKSKRRKGFIARFLDFGTQEDEIAAEVTTYSNNISLESDLEKSLQEIEKALNKIKKNKYGICEKCGSAISEKRLQAFPQATLCVKCKKESE